MNIDFRLESHRPVHSCAEHDKPGYQRDGDSPATCKIHELLKFTAGGAAPWAVGVLLVRE
jgi:hypothetical protein